MIKRIIAGVAALVAMAAAVGTVVVAAAFALYALIKPYLGEAGAAACVALAFALIAGIVALIFAASARGGDRPRRRRGREEEQSPTDRIIELARQRPILAAVGALAAGVVALKNPQVVASVVTTMFATRAADRADRRR